MRKKLWPMYVVGLCTWALLSYGSLFEWLFNGTLLAREIAGRPYISDFVNSYNAGRLARRAMAGPINIYDAKLQDASVRELIAPIVPERPFNLQYPPYFFALMLPLCLFSLQGAWVAWFVFYGIVTWFCLRYLTKDIAGRMERNVAMAMAASTYPMWLSFELGQTALPEFACFTAFFWALQNARQWLAGLMAAFAAVKLQYAPFLGVTGLIMAKWRFLAGGAATMVALLAVSTLVLGPSNIIGYPQALLHGETGGDVSGVAPADMQTVRGWLCLLAGSDSQLVHYIAAAAMVLACAFLAFIWMKGGKKAQSDSRLFRLLASATIFAAVTTSLHTHAQDYVMVSIACLWLWQLPEVQSGEQKWLRRLIVVFPGFSWVCLILKFVFALIKIQPLFFWAVVMLFFTTRLAMESIRTDQHSAQS